MPARASGPTRRPAFELAGRLRHLSDLDRDLIRVANEPGHHRWLSQIRATGGCARPVYLAGHATTYDPVTGAILRHYDTSVEPGGRMPVRCRNRRASRCPTCSRQHAGDTFHLVRAGLLGGKGTPTTVANHPRLFVTLTAPSFGTVHRAGPERCHPRRNGGTCDHGQPVGCRLIHRDDDTAVGSPLCPHCYDYTAHVLWHAHAGELWNRFCRTVRRHLATTAGITQAHLGEHLRVSFAKVMEYQQRGAVHFHAVIRLDGPDGPQTPPPAWATAELLGDAVGTAAATVRVTMPYTEATGEHVFAWGAQLDIRPIRAFGDDSAFTDEAVAAYVAKYTTKSVGDTGGLDHRVTSPDDIVLAAVSPHLRALMGVCWRLGGLPELAHLRLRAWAHMLGYRGHCLTKSRRYSTTYRALRDARTEHLTGYARAAAVYVTDSHWRYLGTGHTRGEAAIAAGIAEDLAEQRAFRRDLEYIGWRSDG